MNRINQILYFSNHQTTKQKKKKFLSQSFQSRPISSIQLRNILKHTLFTRTSVQVQKQFSPRLGFKINRAVQQKSKSVSATIPRTAARNPATLSTARFSWKSKVCVCVCVYRKSTFVERESETGRRAVGWRRAAGTEKGWRSFDNLGHVGARRNSEVDGIITVMLLKLRFFGSVPAISLHRHAFALN